MTLTIGSLCSGYGGLTLAVQAVLGGRVAWHSEYEPPTPKNPRPSQAAARVLEARWPGVPNLGDMTAIDWSTVEPVDVYEGGTPCQDVSHAGKRAGMRAGTRSGLWATFVEGIEVLRPKLVVWENVRGVLSAEADSDLERCPICVGGGSGDALRALGRVLGDLADVGYDARWCGLRASDVGAAHNRFRVFVVAQPSGRRWDLSGATLQGDRSSSDAEGRGAVDADPDDTRCGEQRRPVAAPAEHSPVECGGTADSERVGRVSGERAAGRGEIGRVTPEGRRSATPADAYGSEVREQPESVAGRGRAPLPGHARHTATDPNRDGFSGVAEIDRPNRRMDVEPRDDADRRGLVDWGIYGPAIRRWERILGRAAPAPTRPGPKGAPKLSPEFDEWLMGLPAGWITDVPGISWNDMLKLCGNGVVPQQAAAAITHLLEGE